MGWPPRAAARLKGSVFVLTVPAEVGGVGFAAKTHDGIARLRAAPYGDISIMLEAAAPSYMGAQKDLPVEAVQAIAPAHWFEAVERRPVNFVLAMFAKPDPSVELVLPAGYRGLVKAEVRVQEDAPCPPGQRCFRYEVLPSGQVQVTGPCLLRRVLGPEFDFKYADGTPLSRQGKNSPVGFWWLKSEGHEQVFLIGTQSEYDFARRSYQTQDTGESRLGSGGHGGGRGRRNRRGSPSTAESN